MLLNSPRFRPGDREAWAASERADSIHAQTRAFHERVTGAEDALLAFAESGGCYAGTSWGKDSTCLACMVAEIAPAVPLVWVRAEPIANPDCMLVRDAFLRDHPWCRYDEITLHIEGERPESGALEDGFELAARKWGRRYLSGVRAEESRSRLKRMRAFGPATKQTCAPLGWWSGADVFAYLYCHKLPVHPAYACTMGGLLSRERIRVATIGGERGTGHGRAEWERTYYGARP